MVGKEHLGGFCFWQRIANTASCCLGNFKVDFQHHLLGKLCQEKKMEHAQSPFRSSSTFFGQEANMNQLWPSQGSPVCGQSPMWIVPFRPPVWSSCPGAWSPVHKQAQLESKLSPSAVAQKVPSVPHSTTSDTPSSLASPTRKIDSASEAEKRHSEPCDYQKERVKLSKAKREASGAKRRGPYEHFSASQRTVIAQYAAEHGSTAASRYFSRLLKKRVQRSTVDSMLANWRQLQVNRPFVDGRRRKHTHSSSESDLSECSEKRSVSSETSSVQARSLLPVRNLPLSTTFCKCVIGLKPFLLATKDVR